MGRWRLADKVILITGGGRGIGAAVAAVLAERGAVPVLADIDDDALDKTAAGIGKAAAVHLDVTDYPQCEAVVAGVIAEHGRLDAVWANAGIGIGGPVELVDADIWTRVVQVNLIGAYNTVKAALPAVLERRGYVAITASLASFAHAPGLSAYAASKAGVEAFANSLRTEVAHQGVRVGVLHPTWIATDMVRDGDEGTAWFQRLRESLRPPFAKTYPVESIVGPVADAFEKRQRKVFLPGFVRVAHVARPLLQTRLLERDQLKAAPDIRRHFAEQAEREGGRSAALGPRWGE
jgi:NAD(P)-dependent dehydrogenase (short-subunit alcohol dehydrogenase family)